MYGLSSYAYEFVFTDICSYNWWWWPKVCILLHSKTQPIWISKLQQQLELILGCRQGKLHHHHIKLRRCVRLFSTLSHKAGPCCMGGHANEFWLWRWFIGHALYGAVQWWIKLAKGCALLFDTKSFNSHVPYTLQVKQNEPAQGFFVDDHSKTFLFSNIHLFVNICTFLQVFFYFGAFFQGSKSMTRAYKRKRDEVLHRSEKDGTALQQIKKKKKVSSTALQEKS